MLVLFIIAWCVAAAAWFYGTRFFLPMWIAGFRNKEQYKGYRRKAMIGYAVFVAAIAFGFIVGGVAEFWGGGWE